LRTKQLKDDTQLRDSDVCLSDVLLRWYDCNARTLPWRMHDNSHVLSESDRVYRIWLAEVMLQQTQVGTVIPFYEEFLRRWPTVEDLAGESGEALMSAWAGLGYYARARNLHACARIIVEQHDGRFPDSMSELLRLPGVGAYTAAAISAIAFKKPETVVDGNVERVLARIHAVSEPLPGAKSRIRDLARMHTPQERAGDHAQALMDLGATICRPRNPDCKACPCNAFCGAFAKGLQGALPRRSRTRSRPVRQGLVHVGRRQDGAWLLERRPRKGLLGGALGWPGSSWSAEPSTCEPPCPGEWKTLDGIVRHEFTHFRLQLTVLVGELALSSQPRVGQFVPCKEFASRHLPTVMRKVFDHACSFHDFASDSESGKSLCETAQVKPPALS